ncbi:hypothetical protein BaRGS_00028770 [Batillaria attramentaria]|uniref:Uncharacterized protein n=1 Tax=Batillaria attramentaria TaxID=370345 RepID=A0ABD0JY89_9CAEN
METVPWLGLALLLLPPGGARTTDVLMKAIDEEDLGPESTGSHFTSRPGPRAYLATCLLRRGKTNSFSVFPQCQLWVLYSGFWFSGPRHV